jgi:uncharacterized protein YndB with AHSA1/START domain
MDASATHPYSITVDIQAPPEKVWAVLLDVEHWHQWTPSITGIQRLDSGPLRVGSRARVVQPKLRPAEWVITALEPNRNFTWVTRAPGAQIAGIHLLEPVGTGTRATLSIEISGFLAPLLRRLYGDTTRRYVGMEANGLTQVR